MNTTIQSYCGLECSECEYKKSNGNCNGCVAMGGKMLWGSCPVAKCAIDKNIRFCGECGDFPCELLHSFAFDKENGDNGKRIENCKQIKAELVHTARMGTDHVSVCGHHCDFCFLGKWCGDCRSNYNCCSFATLYPSGKCPNVECATKKGLDGCYDCDILCDCTIGYYGKKDEYAAKAAAMFIKKYGKLCYTATLQRAISSGVKYAADFDSTGSAEKALKLLEKYK